MEIQGLPLGNKAPVNGLEGKNTRKVSSVNHSKHTDSLEISGLLNGQENDYSAAVVKAEFEPRTELVESISRRISDGKYNTRDMIENVSERIIEADVVTDIVNTEFESQAREIKVEEAQNNIESEMYNNHEVFHEVANKLFHILGFSSLFGNNSDR